MEIARSNTTWNQQKKFELSITAEHIVSTDKHFTMNNLYLGDNYVPLNAYFQKADAEIMKRAYNKREQKISNKTLPRLAFQIFEKQLAALSAADRETFPICKYLPDSEIIRGIFTSVQEFRARRNSLEYLTYDCGNDRQFVIYCWNLFSTVLFVQECLKRFGQPGDQFLLIYREKAEYSQLPTYQNPFSEMLLESKNLIFRGAPGTGKTYLAKKIAADLVSNGTVSDYSKLTDEQKKQVEFVQFHPSYDYSDFVEGLRPKLNSDGSMGFELQDGIFKRFVSRARKNYEDAQKPIEMVERELSAQESMSEFFSSIAFGEDSFETITGNTFTITSVDEQHINIFIPQNDIIKQLTLSLDEIRKMLESEQTFEKIKDITNFFGKTYATQAYSYDFAIYKAIRKRKHLAPRTHAKTEEFKKYVFIIDEINRGEISKIFGELFFAIDPGYRGKAGEIATQYANLHPNPAETFYVPENVYLIGTMNDIDRSVDSFDFAMRRRFRFVELKANEQLEMLTSLGNEELKSEMIRRMTALNQEIAAIEDLNENYQIGAAYFLKLKTLDFDQLWTDYLQPLLQEYIHGMYHEEEIMNRFANAYGYQKGIRGDRNEPAQDQR